jgi:copper chaperone NosL
MIRAITIFVTAAILLGCSRHPQALAPPEIQLGQTDCAQCGMTVSDDRYAAAVIVETSAGDRLTKVFDDIGCFAAYLREQHDGQVLAQYVKDYSTRGWLVADQALYVHADSIRSPMAYGLLATATQDTAQTIAKDKNGKVIRFSNIQAAPEATAIAK